MGVAADTRLIDEALEWGEEEEEEEERMTTSNESSERTVPSL